MSYGEELGRRGFVYDAFGRMVTATGIIGEEGPVVTARHRYNGLGFRIMWQYDADTDGTLEDAERYYQMHDERWRVIAVFRNQDATPKEGYVHHAAGLGGYGSSSYIDSVILRDRDANAAWTSASDGTLEERRYYCQNWRADVVAITKSDGYPLEYIRYSSYGEPTVYPVADINMDGVVNSTDLTEWALLQGSASTNAAYATSDINFDGSEDSLDGDLFYFDSYLANSGLSGKGKLSSPAVGNRIGYAGYAWDPSIKAYHVRHRVLLPEIGRWSRRDPIGYVDGVNLLVYVNARPLSTTDPTGLIIDPLILLPLIGPIVKPMLPPSVQVVLVQPKEPPPPHCGVRMIQNRFLLSAYGPYGHSWVEFPGSNGVEQHIGYWPLSGAFDGTDGVFWSPSGTDPQPPIPGKINTCAGHDSSGTANEGDYEYYALPGDVTETVTDPKTNKPINQDRRLKFGPPGVKDKSVRSATCADIIKCLENWRPSAGYCFGKYDCRDAARGALNDCGLKPGRVYTTKPVPVIFF